EVAPRPIGKMYRVGEMEGATRDGSTRPVPTRRPVRGPDGQAESAACVPSVPIEALVGRRLGWHLGRRIAGPPVPCIGDELVVAGGEEAGLVVAGRRQLRFLRRAATVRSLILREHTHLAADPIGPGGRRQRECA